MASTSVQECALSLQNSLKYSGSILNSLRQTSEKTAQKSRVTEMSSRYKILTEAAFNSKLDELKQQSLESDKACLDELMKAMKDIHGRLKLEKRTLVGQKKEYSESIQKQIDSKVSAMKEEFDSKMKLLAEKKQGLMDLISESAIVEKQKKELLDEYEATVASMGGINSLDEIMTKQKACKEVLLKHDEVIGTLNCSLKNVQERLFAVKETIAQETGKSTADSGKDGEDEGMNANDDSMTDVTITLHNGVPLTTTIHKNESVARERYRYQISMLSRQIMNEEAIDTKELVVSLQKDMKSAIAKNRSLLLQTRDVVLEEKSKQLEDSLNIFLNLVSKLPNQEYPTSVYGPVMRKILERVLEDVPDSVAISDISDSVTPSEQARCEEGVLYLCKAGILNIIDDGSVELNNLSQPDDSNEDYTQNDTIHN
eukprot:Nk52_evm7s710 gene=Nk52_evmTU7s710